MPVVDSFHADTGDFGGLSFSKMDEDMVNSDLLQEGVVEVVIPGVYTMACTIANGLRKCIFCPSMISHTLGIDECFMPQEGASVLGYKPAGEQHFYIIAVLPDTETGYDPIEIEKIEDPGRETSPEINPEPGADYTSLNAYMGIAEDDTTDDHIPTASGRPFNIMAGEWMRGNKLGVYVAVMQLYSALAAGDRAKLEMFLLDGMVRLTSGTFEHNNPLGMTRMFDDEGNLMVESCGSIYQHERLGEDDFKEILKDEPKGEATEKQITIKRPEEDITPKDRYRFFGGALADMFQLYTKNPTGDDSPERSADSRMAIGYDGSISGVSRSGVYFGLRNKIPMPLRIRAPWDPEGSIFDPDAEGGIQPEPKEPFQHNADFPYGRNLASLDARAWYERNLLKRFDEATRDFKVPEYKDVTEPPTTNTDKAGSTTENKVAVDAGWEVTADGGIRFWDGSGAEIYMRGGVIYMTAPGGIQRHVGKSDVTLAGHDIIQKAYNSIDLTTTKKDIRIAAKGTAHIHSIDKATMVTSAATSAKVDGTGVGEDANNKGVIIGGGKTSVVIAGQDVSVVAEKNVNVKGNNVILVAINRISSAARSLILEANGTAALNLLGSTCSLLGRSIQLAADSGLSFFRRNQVGVLQNWTDIETNPYQQQLGGITRLHGNYYETDQWLPVSPNAISAVRFTYRTPKQYGTDKASEVDDNATEFHVYSPAWALESWKQLTGVNISTEEWTEEDVEKTFPWPGAGVRESALVTYEPGSNVKDGELANRKEMLPYGGTYETVSMDEYKVVK